MDTAEDICKTTVLNLDAYHDGELPESEQASVTAHLATCESCSAKLSSIHELVGTLQQAPRVELSPDFSDRLDKKLKSTEKRNRFHNGLWGTLGIAAAIIMLVLVAKPGNIGVIENVTAKNDTKELPPIIRNSADTHSNQQLSQKNLGPEATSNPPSTASVPHQQSQLAASPKKSHPANSIETNLADNKSESIAEHKFQTDRPIQIRNDNVIYDNTELADLSGVDAFTEAMGLSTDEDGLYDIKL